MMEKVKSILKAHEQDQAQNQDNVAPTLTTSFGAPIDDNQHSITVGPSGPILLQDTVLIEKLANFNRERIPERVVHAKGAGAHGYFEVTHDITKYCKAEVFNKVGKRTPVFVRFSVVNIERGGPDAIRDPRGFAIKHYTEQGIWDLAANNTPLFFVRDPTKFPEFIRSQRRNPQTNLQDANAYWDFASLVPESIHQFLYLFGERGIPLNYRHMNGYGTHTFKMVNDHGEAFFVKFHYKSDVGWKSFTPEKAVEMCGKDPDHATRDLYDFIAGGNEATWTLYLQVMPVEEAKKFKWDVFDVTKIWPHSEVPLIPVGRLVLNRNPTNYFAEVEQAAFDPSHLVPGIEPSPDRMLQARLFAYADAQRHRLGGNYGLIPINCPYRSNVAHYMRDGLMTVDGNGGKSPAYEPNSFSNAPKQDEKYAMHPYYVEGWVRRTPLQHPNDDFEQPRMLFRKVFDDEARTLVINNLVGHMSKVTKPEITERMIKILTRVDAELGRRVAEGLDKSKLKPVSNPAKEHVYIPMSHEQNILPVPKA